LEKLQFILYLPFSNRQIYYVLTIFLIVFVISLTKLETYYVYFTINDDKAIIGFVGFIPNLLNRRTDGITISVRKSYFSFAYEYVKLPFSLRVPKGDIFGEKHFCRWKFVSFTFRNINEKHPE
jgi:hypothetical protein